MADDMDRELKELEAFMLKAEREEIPVPPILEARIRERGRKLKRRVSFHIKTGAAAAILLAAFFASALLIPQIAVFASDIPGIGTVLDWLRGDSGIEYARKHGYSVINGVTIKRDDYTLIVDSIFFDEDRLSLKAAMEGPLVKESIEKYHKSILEAFVDLDDGVGVYSNTHSNDNGDPSRIVVDIEHIFEEGAAKKFLEGDPECLSVQICLYTEDSSGERTDIKKDEVRIPFSRDRVLMSKVYDINRQKEIKVDRFISGLNIDVEKLAVSPTRLWLDTNIALPDGFCFSGFENARLVDDRGNVYKSEGLVSVGTKLYFVPSVYFDVPERLIFKYDGFRLAKEEGGSFMLRMDEPLPKTIEYMGEKIKILKAEYSNDKGWLSIDVQFPDPDILRIQNLNIEGSARAGWSARDPGSDHPVVSECFIEIDRRDVYEVRFEGIGYLIKEPGEIELSLIR